MLRGNERPVELERYDNPKDLVVLAYFKTGCMTRTEEHRS